MKLDKKIYLPIWLEEQAWQNANSLLAKPIYEKIAQFIGTHLERIQKPRTLSSSQNARAHETILISGDRGTGKSAVLANLRTYLEQQQLPYDRLLILNPVDPTLLDSDHDLLLNIIVAAIIRDSAVSKRLDDNDDHVQEFYASLHKLGSALEVVQTRSEKYGLDRLRSFMGNHGLADEIHKFFHQTLILMQKDLIILPIDDVDTSLNHAFENLEIVRKYLASKLVLPIISGDIKLYHEVIWRDMHGRMLKESRAEESNAIPKAKSLAQEYEIKVLPLSRRLAMPRIEEYLKNKDIVLVDNRPRKVPKELMSLPNYIAWIEALLNERVNGVENSRLTLPIRSLRLLTQVISTTRNEIPEISDALPDDAVAIRRSVFMPIEILLEINEFSNQLAKANSSSPSAKQRILNLATKSLYILAQNGPKQDRASIHQIWARNLSEHFRSQHDAGAPYLILSAWLAWLEQGQDSNEDLPYIKIMANSRILNLPLFMPTIQQPYEEFDQQYELRSSWRKQIPDRYAPESWFSKLPERAILPYPLPELGRQMSSLGQFSPSKDDALSERAQLLRLIMVHRNFYSRSEKTAMVFCGRLFEIVVSSFVRDLTRIELATILDDHPFYSLTMLANTKTLDFHSEEEELQSTTSEQLTREDENRALPDYIISDLLTKIQAWRRKNKLSIPHPWIFYNVMNKFFNQVAIFNPREARNNAPGSMLEMAITASKAFNALWATFGSFEKGPLFGVDTTIAYQNVGAGEFIKSPLYYMNVAPLEQLPPIMGSYTRALATHPIRQLIANVREELSPPSGPDTGVSSNRRRGRGAAS
ncbi:hypothetical protein J2X56_003113 [Herbaspirillum sp. 1173]|uniref:antiviral RADAR system adenosine triphosphatase RdrA n=1 Tax=Herbaspirillum sp. 1173 TaxID=2817734 RepID=UPI00286081D8|nr:antiviral RADAR system adenosine triphosphatase RdrA [Herbaspirillum sp. 1173]MDR6741089.1 hypothetical protein [Herbaspirillum sp. 1173]